MLINLGSIGEEKPHRATLKKLKKPQPSFHGYFVYFATTKEVGVSLKTPGRRSQTRSCNLCNLPFNLFEEREKF